MWRRHSLSIVMFGLGTIATLISFMLPEGRWFDTISAYGASFTAVALYNFCKGPLMEVNSEDKPIRRSKSVSRN